MKKNLAVLTTIFFIAALTLCAKKQEETPLSKQASAGDTGFTYKIAIENIEFNWRVDGKDLKVKCRAKTAGWVGVGFNASEGMNGAQFIMGYIKDGKAVISEQYGTSKTMHKKTTEMGGVDVVKNPSGLDRNNMTEIEFTIPLTPPGSLDKPIKVNENTVLMLAYGQTKMIMQQHAYRAKLLVDLSSGKYGVVVAGAK